MTLKELEMRANKSGRHDKSFAVILSDLKGILRTGAPDVNAYTEAGISHDTFHRWLKESEEFREEIERARQYKFNVSEKITLEAIEEGDARLALDYLKLRDKRYSTTTKQEHSGEVSLPILGGLSKLNVQSDDSNTQTGETE